MTSLTRRRFLASTTVAFASSAATVSGATEPKPTVVLVHGAFADGAIWRKVIPLVRSRGHRVVAVQNPLTSLEDDVACVRRALAAQSGPVILVGHSWGGTVITEAGNDEKVKGLVYVGAYAPMAGQTTADIFAKADRDVPADSFLADESGYLRLSDKGIRNAFAQDIPEEEAQLIAATQGPIRFANFDQRVTVEPWRTRPSWALVTSEDRIIPAALQMEMANGINAKTVIAKSGHAPMLSRPSAVAGIISAAMASLWLMPVQSHKPRS